MLASELAEKLLDLVALGDDFEVYYESYKVMGSNYYKVKSPTIEKDALYGGVCLSGEELVTMVVV